jgi:hypothetical protein
MRREEFGGEILSSRTNINAQVFFFNKKKGPDLAKLRHVSEYGWITGGGHEGLKEPSKITELPNEEPPKLREWRENESPCGGKLVNHKFITILFLLKIKKRKRNSYHFHNLIFSSFYFCKRREKSMAQIETLGILEEIEPLVSDKLQVVTNSSSLQHFLCIHRNLSLIHEIHDLNSGYYCKESLFSRANFLRVLINSPLLK